MLHAQGERFIVTHSPTLPSPFWRLGTRRSVQRLRGRTMGWGTRSRRSSSPPHSQPLAPSSDSCRVCHGNVLKEGSGVGASTLLSCPRTPYHSPRRSSPQHFQHWFRRLPVSSFGSQRRGADSRRQHNRDSPAHAPTCQRDGGWSLGATESGWVRARPRR